jgi:hypothetical protein
MRRFCFASLLIGLGPLAQAQGNYPYGGNAQPYSYGQPYPQGSYAEGPVARAADRLLEDTAELRTRVAREVPPEQGSQAMAAMDRLQRQAQRFEQSVDNLGPDNEATQAEFGRLANAYGHAANAMEILRGYPDVYQQFAQVQHEMDRLAPMFGGYQHYGYQYANPPAGGYRMTGPGLNLDVGGLQLHIGHD